MLPSLHHHHHHQHPSSTAAKSPMNSPYSTRHHHRRSFRDKQHQHQQNRRKLYIIFISLAFFFLIFLFVFTGKPWDYNSRWRPLWGAIFGHSKNKRWNRIEYLIGREETTFQVSQQQPLRVSSFSHYYSSKSPLEPSSSRSTEGQQYGRLGEQQGNSPYDDEESSYATNDEEDVLNDLHAEDISWSHKHLPMQHLTPPHSPSYTCPQNQKVSFTEVALDESLKPRIRSGERMCTYIDPATGLIQERVNEMELPIAGGYGFRLCLFIHPAEKVRVNVIYHDISGLHYGISAGPQGIINMLLAAERLGYHIRFVVLEDFVPRDRFPQKLNYLKRVFQENGYGDMLDRADFWFAGYKDYSDPMPVSPADVFLAGYWPTAFPAHAAARDLARTHFIYLVSDYEPLFYPASTAYAYSYETYTLPHHLVTNTPVMLKYLKHQKHSVFSSRFNSDPNIFSLPLRHPIARILPDPNRIRARMATKKRKVLIYARVLARNGFDLISTAIRTVYKEGGFNDKDWEFYGIGHHQPPQMEEPEMIHLGSFPKEEYADRLSDFDLGISLILTPNMNFAQLDFAAAGMITVVNSFETKQQRDYDHIGSNFVVGEPTAHGLAKAIREGIRRVEDVDARISAGYNLNWSHKFDDTFTDSVLDHFDLLLRDIQQCRWATKEADKEIDYYPSHDSKMA